jgi:hypothetical protein
VYSESQLTQLPESEFAKKAKGVQKKNFWKIRFDEMRDAMNIPPNKRYIRSCQSLFESEFMSFLAFECLSSKVTAFQSKKACQS